MKNKKQIEINSMILAASHFLYEDLPNDFYKWSEKKLIKYCKHYAWQPFEYHDGSDILKYITNLSNDFLNFKNESEVA